MTGADFIKTSTGKEGVNATFPVALVMVRAIRDYYERTRHKVLVLLPTVDLFIIVTIILIIYIFISLGMSECLGEWKMFDWHHKTKSTSNTSPDCILC